MRTGSPSSTGILPRPANATRHCPGLWRGKFTLGYTDDGYRTRRKVSGKTKAAVVDKLQQLHHELDKGIVPKTGYANCTVRPAAQDWLANGLDGRLAKTVKKNQIVLEPILKVIGTRKLRHLTAAGSRANDNVMISVTRSASASDARRTASGLIIRAS